VQYWGADSNTFITGGNDSSMRLFDLRDPSHFTVLFESKLKTPILHSAVNEHCTHQVAVLNQRSGIVNVLDTRKPKLVQAELEHRS